MSYNNIQIQNIDKSARVRKRKVYHWLNELARNHKYGIESLSINICSDEYLLLINREYLNHDYYTDIITFDLRDNNKLKAIEGDIYISIDRVKDNAKVMKFSQEMELMRVIAHGLLHLMGFKDKTEKEKERMRDAENRSIDLYENLFHVK